MKICITGIAGFIGSQLAKHLVQDGHTVTGIDSLDWGYPEDIPEECKWALIDILYLDRWLSDPNTGDPYSDAKATPSAILGDVNLVIHCAANLAITNSLAEPTSDLRINTEGTIQVLEMMKTWGIKNILNFSSACVYGEGAHLMLPIAEAQVRLFTPHWPYGASKLAAEIYCNLYAGTADFNVINVRPGIVCGPGEWYGRALTIFLRRALERKPIVVFVDPGHRYRTYTAGTDGTPKRDFVHINDVIGHVRACLVTYPARFSGTVRTFNMGSESQFSILQLANKVGAALDMEVVLEEVAQGDTSQLVEDRVRIPHEMKGMYLDMSKVAQALDYQVIGSTMGKIIDDEVIWLKNGGLERWQEAEMKV